MSQTTIFFEEFIALVAEYFRCGSDRAAQIVENAQSVGKLNGLVAMVRFKR